MKKIFISILVTFATLQGFSQCACCSGASIGSTSGDSNNGILTLSKNQIIAETYADFRTIKIVSIDPLAEETPLKSLLINTVGLRYGISDKFTISALLPYVFLKTNTGNDKGLGDLIVMGTYNIYSKKSLNIALQAGIELPTGTQKSSNFDNTTVVLGSGSYDPIAGIVVSKNWNNFILQGNAMVKLTTPGFEKNYYGSLSVQNLSLIYKAKKMNIDESKNAKTEKSDFGLSFSGGYTSEWLDNLYENHVKDENSGYYLGFANLGTNLAYKKWSFPVTYSLPVVKKMNGDQNDPGFRLRFGVIKSF